MGNPARSLPHAARAQVCCAAGPIRAAYQAAARGMAGRSVPGLELAVCASLALEHAAACRSDACTVCTVRGREALEIAASPELLRDRVVLAMSSDQFVEHAARSAKENGRGATGQCAVCSTSSVLPQRKVLCETCTILVRPSEQVVESAGSFYCTKCAAGTNVVGHLTTVQNEQVEEASVECVRCSKRAHVSCVIALDLHNFVCPACCAVGYPIRNSLLAEEIKATEDDEFIQSYLEAIPGGGRGLCVRTLSITDELTAVPEAFATFAEELANRPAGSFPRTFTGKLRFLGVFERQGAVDVLFFGMIGKEFDISEPPPNRLTATVAFLEAASVTCGRVGDASRGTVNFAVIHGYFEMLRRRGFTRVIMWQCPPSLGQDYIFHAKPTRPSKAAGTSGAGLRGWYKAFGAFISDRYPAGEPPGITTEQRPAFTAGSSAGDVVNFPISAGDAVLYAFSAVTGAAQAPTTAPGLWAALKKECGHPAYQYFIATLHAHPSPTIVIDETEVTSPVFGDRAKMLDMCIRNNLTFDSAHKARRSTAMLLSMHKGNRPVPKAACRECGEHFSAGGYFCGECVWVYFCAKCGTGSGSITHNHGRAFLKTYSDV